MLAPVTIGDPPSNYKVQPLASYPDLSIRHFSGLLLEASRGELKGAAPAPAVLVNPKLPREGPVTPPVSVASSTYVLNDFI